MQLFITDPCPQMCSIALDNKRVIKGTLETAQLISTVVGRGYKATHEHHAVTHWAKRHLKWVSAHYLSLTAEYFHRSGKDHATLKVVGDMAYELADFTPLLSHRFLNYARNHTRNLNFVWIDDPCEAYRTYLRARWINDTRTPLWTNREPPEWISDGEGFGSMRQRLAMRARRFVGFVRANTHGHIDCPRCGDIIEWYCEDQENFVEFRCVTPGCLNIKEVKK